ncbi:MAG: 2-hydroxyacyl-CoA dehydratase, partial [Deltaproteobacteria bacterium]|nr:2-hydroxyacyl-CoA dehydratase [Deltaproteobacteria bacterium]
MSKVGFTTTIPLEILIAAKRTPVDLNNIFITHPDKKELLIKAE